MDINEAQKHPFQKGKVLLIDKPLKWTSFDVVKKIRWLIRKNTGIKKIKVGHAGTLDPLATGLLVVCTGRKTKTINEIQALQKEYTGTIYVGATTPSYDLETEVDATFETAHIDKEMALEAAQQLTGDLLQTPPVFSAKRIDGTKAYKKARKGEKVTMRKHAVTVHRFEITRFELPEIEFRVVCSKGTYIRSLAYDFGKQLNSGAYLAALRRTAIGAYSVEEAISIQEFEQNFSKYEAEIAE